MTLADYLAKNYLTADSKPDKKSGKKRKRKAGAESTAGEGQGLLIASDDATGWERGGGGGRGSRNARGTGGRGLSDDDDEDNDGPVTVASHRTAEFRRAQRSNWKTLTGAPAVLDSERYVKNGRGDDDEDAAADAIIASAAAEAKARGHADGDGDDEQPTIVDNEDDEDEDEEEEPRMESGARAGLVSAAELAAQMTKTKTKKSKPTKGKSSEAQQQQETIYRDASGRIVNVAMRRAELRAAAEAEERKKAQEADEARGDVQLAERARRRQELKDAQYMTVARYADDEDLNRELRERERWNDPAAMFMPTKKDGGSGAATGGGGAGLKPTYKGYAPPNRYGIKPGHRWDGVDRSNGFEKEYFAAQNRRRNIGDLKYAWQMDE